MHDPSGVEAVECWGGPLDGQAFYLGREETGLPLSGPYGHYQRLDGTLRNWMAWRQSTEDES